MDSVYTAPLMYAHPGIANCPTMTEKPISYAGKKRRFLGQFCKFLAPADRTKMAGFLDWLNMHDSKYSNEIASFASTYDGGTKLCSTSLYLLTSDCLKLYSLHTMKFLNTMKFYVINNYRVFDTHEEDQMKYTKMIR